MKVASKHSGVCCANVLYSRQNGIHCCLNFKLRQGITYSQRKQICCEGEILDKERLKSERELSIAMNIKNTIFCYRLQVLALPYSSLQVKCTTFLLMKLKIVDQQTHYLATLAAFDLFFIHKNYRFIFVKIFDNKSMVPMKKNDE